jgi:ubiquinone biosynthesis protein UbiJ
MNRWIEQTFQNALNRYLALDPESKSRLHALDGKTIAIELSGLGLHFHLEFTRQEIKLNRNAAIKPDTTIKGTPFSMLHMSLARHDRKKFFAEDVIIEGNIELGQKAIDLFDSLEIDWEEYASHWIGDVSAHQLGRFIKKTVRVGKKIRLTLRENMNEYIHEEIDLFPPGEALSDFFNDVDTLRMDVDRLEVRLEKLSKEV